MWVKGLIQIFSEIKDVYKRQGYGSVHKLKGKRRKPWRARITDGFVYDLVEDKQVQKYKTLGYYETKQKALQALAAYNENPYDLDADKITFAECYEKRCV